jgi:Domain of unknown function (DUF4390)
MTAFSLPCWKTLRSLLSACSIVLASLLPWAADAEGISIKKADLVAAEEAYLLRADFDIDLAKPIEDALERGITLNFLVDLEVTRPRWYWVDESIASVRQHVRISYHALSRQYQITSNTQHRSFATLAEAKDELKRIVDWKVFERALLKKGTSYSAALRMKLDLKQLPKPLQVDALGNKEWDLASEWFRFTLTP